MSLSKGKIKKPKRKPRKGFTRKAKDWEESIATHIGKIIDNLKGKDILDLISAGVCAYAGYEAAEKVGAPVEARFGTAGAAILAYQLAKQPNLIVGASGLGFLATLGLLNVWNPMIETTTDFFGTFGASPAEAEKFRQWWDSGHGAVVMRG